MRPKPSVLMINPPTEKDGQWLCGDCSEICDASLDPFLDTSPHMLMITCPGCGHKDMLTQDHLPAPGQLPLFS